MRTWAYPARFAVHEPDEVVVSFSDLPEALTGAATLEAARVLAADVLEEAILHYLALGLPIPQPRDPGPGEEAVLLDPVTAARAALATAMREQKVSNVALAKRLGRSEGAVRRLTDGATGVKIDTVLQALNAVGRRAGLATEAA